MIFLKAVPTVDKPFVRWESVAMSLEEAIAKDLIDDPLVLPFEMLPDYQYGVCPLKIIGGALIARTESEMDAFYIEFTQQQHRQAQQQRANVLNNGTFVFDSKTFPMYEAARLLYSAINYLDPANTKVMDVTGVDYVVTPANSAAFLSAYYVELRSIIIGL